ncbi:MAG: hypothetical protein ACRDZZ_02465, partial [Ilumatobacteraceae bacterium]
MILNTADEDDVFDAAAGKRDAELANMRVGSKGIGPTDPRRQSLETFFQDPAHQKGSRSRPAAGPGSGPRAHGGNGGRGTTPPTTLPDVLVAGPDTSVTPRLPEQATAERTIQEVVDAGLAKNPALAPVIGPLQAEALAQIGAMGRSKLSKVTHGAGEAGDSAKLTSGVTSIVDQFRKDVAREVEQAAWEGTVKQRAAFVNTKPDKAMAERALDRAKNAIPFANDIYDKLYAVVAFDEPAIGEISKGSCEQGLLDLCAVVPPGDWSALLGAITKDTSLLAFAIAHRASLGVADTAAVVRVWHANEAALTSAADCAAILALTLVNSDPAIGVRAARLLRTPQVPDLAALTALDTGGNFASITEIASLTKLGGDLSANKAMRALSPAPNDDDIKAFNTAVGRTPAEAAASWNALTTNVADAQKKYQIIRTLKVVPSATKTDFDRLVTNYAALMDRTTISGNTVALLVDAGVLQPLGKTYTSGNWGHG